MCTISFSLLIGCDEFSKPFSGGEPKLLSSLERMRSMSWPQKAWVNKESLLSYQKGWKQRTIDASSSGADGVKLADINKDGQFDIVTGWEEGGITKLYLYPENDKITQAWPAVEIGKTPSVEDAVFVDMNADGQLDVVSCTEHGSEKIFVHWSPKKDFLNPKKWKQEILPASEGLMMWMYAEPVQVDGQHGIDLVAAGKGENAAIGWFEAPENTKDLGGWQWHTISPVGWVMSVVLRDMDKDGDMDVVITDRKGGLTGCRWLENPGDLNRQRQAWKNHFIGAEGLEVMFMDMADLDGDGMEEAIVTERSEQTIRIYQKLDETAKAWKEQTIALPASTGKAKSVVVGDINGDEINDLVYSSNTYGEDKVGLMWIDGNRLTDSSEIKFHAISGAHNAKFDKVELLDVDEDGDLDVLICEENYGVNSEGLGLIWYENPIK